MSYSCTDLDTLVTTWGISWNWDVWRVASTGMQVHVCMHYMHTSNLHSTYVTYERSCIHLYMFMKQRQMRCSKHRYVHRTHIRIYFLFQFFSPKGSALQIMNIIQIHAGIRTSSLTSPRTNSVTFRNHAVLRCSWRLWRTTCPSTILWRAAWPRDCATSWRMETIWFWQVRGVRVCFVWYTYNIHYDVKILVATSHSPLWWRYRKNSIFFRILFLTYNLFSYWF